MSNKFRILQRATCFHPNKVQQIVLVIVALHKMLRQEDGAKYLKRSATDEDVSLGLVPQGQRHQLMELQYIVRRTGYEEKDIREERVQEQLQ